MGSSATVTINITAQGRNAQQVIAAIRAQLGSLGPTFQQNTRQANQFGSAISKLRNQVFALKLAYEGAQFFSRFIAEGLKFNQVVETGTLAIGTLITATGRLVTNEGRVLVGTEALAEAMTMASDQVNKLRVDGLRTAATTEQLIDAFQQATGAGIAAGLTLDQIRRTTVQIVLAAGNLGVPMNQLNQEVRSILEATIDRNSRVARILGITNAQVKLAREQGTLAEFLNQKLQAFTVASEKSLETWQVIRSNMVEAFQVLAGDVTRPFFDKVKEGFKEVLGAAFDFDRAAINESFKGLIEGGQAFFAEFGDIVKNAIHVAVVGAQNLSEWFRANRVEVQLLVAELGDTARAVGSLVGSVVRVLAGIVKWGTESGAFIAVLNTIQTILQTIERLIGIIIFGAIAKATLGIAGFAKGIGKAVLGLSGLARIFQSFGAMRFLAGAATPIGALIVAIGGLVTIFKFLEARHAIIQAQRDAMVDQIRTEKGAITDLSTSYVDLARNILNGTSTNREMASTMRSMAAVTDDIAKKDAAFAATALRISQVLRVQAGAIEANVTARENLAVEQQKLEAQLTKADLKGADRIRIQNRLSEITREMSGLERVYADMVRDSTEAIRDNIDAQLEAAEARVATAEGEKAAAGSILAALQADRAALEAAIPGTTDLQLRRELREDIELLDQRIQRYKDSMRGFADGVEVARTSLAKLRSEIAKGPGTTLEGQPGFKEGDAAKKAARAKQQNDLKQFIEAQIEIVRAGEKAITAELERQLDAREIGIADFNQKMINVQFAAITRIAGLRSRLVAGLDDPGERQQQIGEIEELEKNVLQIISERGRRQLDMEKDLNEKVLKSREQLAEAEGRLAEAAGLKFEKEWADTIAQLQVEGRIADIEILMTLKGREEVKAGIEGLFNTIDLQQQRLDAGLAAIQARVAAGALAPVDAVKETIKQYEIMQGVIRQTQASLFLLFGATKNPEFIAAIIKLKEAWEDNDEAISNANESLNGLRNALFEAVESGFMEFLTGDHLTKLNQYDTAFRNMALSIIRSIRQMIAQIIAFKIVSAAFGAFGIQIPGSQAPFAPGKARGGYIRGPGTETSDSIPARLSRGEYVLSARTVKKIGVGLLDQLNFGASPFRLRKSRNFARGGLVESEATHGARGELTATIGLEEGLFIKHLQSSGVKTALLKMIAKNPRAFRAAMITG